LAIKRHKFAGQRGALTLVEALVAMVILTVAVIGASGYRYYAMLDARKAWMQRTGAAIALLLCENWRGRGYDHTADFDPTGLSGSALTINIGVGPDKPADFTLRGSYPIIADGVHYWATLSYREEATPGLRALNVVVAWKQAGSDPDTYSSDAKTFKLTTFVSD